MDDDRLRELFEENNRLERERMLVTQELLATARERLYAEQRFNDVLALLLELLSDGLEEMAETLHKLESYQALILGAMVQPGEARNLLENDQHKREHLERVIRLHRRTLRRLREKEAIYGADTPVSILNQIEIIETQIETSQSELEQFLPNGPDPTRSDT